MTKDKLKRLGKRAIACRGWHWMAGMMTLDGELAVYATPPGSEDQGPHLVQVFDERIERLRGVWLHKEQILPDLSYPSTLGALLALVRAAWKDDGLSATFWEGEDDGVAGGWDITDGDISVLGVQVATEAEALLLALEFAPGFEP